MICLGGGGAWGQVPPQLTGLTGVGSAADPFLISSRADLEKVAAYFNETDVGTTQYYHYKQMGPVDLQLMSWTPIGGMDADINPEAGKRFMGYYDGNGQTISGLTVDATAGGFADRPNNIGLFGRVGEGTASQPVVIRDVHLVNVGTVRGGSGTGALVGRVTGNVYTLIEGCSVETARTAEGVPTGRVEGTRVTGGLVGANNSFASSPGSDEIPVVSRCLADIPVLGYGTLTGTAKQKFGGLVGCNQKGATYNSYARGSVTITGGTAERVGGLAGCADIRGVIDRCYATGSIVIDVDPGQAVTAAGGLVGNLTGPGNNRGTATNSYWDMDASGIASSAGGTGKTSEEMRQQTTFVNWDFDNIWNIDGPENPESYSGDWSEFINNGYPSLEGVGAALPQAEVDIYWTGAVDENWNNPQNWDPMVVPGPGKWANISAGEQGFHKSETFFPVLSGAATTSGVWIGEGASLTIGPNGTMTVLGPVDNEAGAAGLILQSDAGGTGSLIHDNAGFTGGVLKEDASDPWPLQATIRRHIAGEEIPPSGTDASLYHLVSVPLAPESPGIVSGLFMDSYLYGFDVGSQAWVAAGEATDLPLNVASGYMVYYPGNARVYEFAGPVNQGLFSMLVSYDGYVKEETAGSYNLVPNPYPSPVDWDAVKAKEEDPEPWVKTDIDNTIWIWNGTADNGASSPGNYASYVGATDEVAGVGTNGATSLIPVGQAFFVKAVAGSPALQVNDNARVHSDQPFFKRTASDQDGLLRIRASAGGLRDEAVVRFVARATPGHDPQYDASKMFGVEQAPQLYAVAADQQRLSVYSHPHPTESLEIPLGLEMAEDREVRLDFSGAGRFDDQLEVLLEDLVEGRTIDLRQQDQYVFAHRGSNDPLRFVLHFVPQGTTGTPGKLREADFRIFASRDRIRVHIPALDGQEATVEVFDMLGRRWLRSEEILSGGTSVTAHGLQGVALVRVTAHGQVFSQRVILK